MDDDDEFSDQDSVDDTSPTDFFPAPNDSAYDKSTREGTPTIESGVPEASPELPGFQLGEKLGEGGMGIVYIARDLVVGRDVAIKFLKSIFVDRESSLNRFMEEARITGQLQHPGIPPVHQIGTIHGRPFIVMKLIKGRTLQKLIDLGNYIGPDVFEAVCRTLAYAHDRNVIHRDLKPSNIMVGAFGQVQVMDWGLAKLVTEENPTPDGTDIRTERKTPHEGTAEGSAIGTPAYMPPEQAVGDLSRVDCRSDVFGLGALLCAILTGKPPYIGRVDGSVKAKAIAGRLEPAFRRLDQCGREPELIELCKRCLSFSRSDRPADAGVVADEVVRIRQRRERRLAELEIEKQTDEVRRGEELTRRRLRTRAAAAIAAVLVVGLMGTTIGLLLARDNAASARAAELKERAARAEAEAAGEVAKRRYRSSLDAYTQLAFSVQDELEQLPGTSQARKYVLNRAKIGLRDLIAEQVKDERPDHALIRAHLKLGDLYLFTGDVAAAEAEYQAGHKQAVALLFEEPASTIAKRDLIECLARLGDSARKSAGKRTQADGHYAEAETMAGAEVASAPDDPAALRLLAFVRSRRGYLLLEHRRIPQALTALKGVFELRLRLAALPDALKSDRRALGEARLILADVLEHSGNAEAAAEQYAECCRLCKALMEADRGDVRYIRDYAVACHRHGDFLHRQDNHPQSRACYAEALACNRKLHEGDPQHDGFRRGLAVSLEKIGDSCFEERNYPEAKKHYLESLSYRNQCFAVAGDDPALMHELAVSHHKLADYHRRQRHREDARVQCRRSLEFFAKRAAADPGHTAAKSDEYTAMKLLAAACEHCHDYDEAGRIYESIRRLAAEQLATETNGDHRASLQGLIADSAKQILFCEVLLKSDNVLDRIGKLPEEDRPSMYVAWIRLAASRKDRAAVQATLDRVRDDWEHDRRRDYDLALVSAVASTFAPDEATKKKHEDFALIRLRFLVDLGLVSRQLCDELEEEIGFDSLRAHPKFLKLIDELHGRISNAGLKQ